MSFNQCPLVRSDFSILFLSIFRQYELFISEYLIKAEKQLADGLLKKVVVQSVSRLPSNLFA